MEEHQNSTFKNVIVIGASAGGFTAVNELLSQLPESINAAIFLVLHVSESSNAENIIHYFQKNTSLRCTVPKQGTIIRKGHMYLAPGGSHMFIKGMSVNLNKGARENKYRPSIDVLFRSAAVNFGSRVIGIILSGMMDDGTSGMIAIKRCGGICVVQEPSDAEFSDMPQSVINQIQVDYRLPLKDIGSSVIKLTSEPLPPKIEIPRELIKENEISEKMISSIDELREIADHTVLTCPECGGGLWAIRNEPVQRFRCHTGHVYTEKILLETQGLNLEESVWVSVRMLEERHNLLSLMVSNSENSGNFQQAQDFKLRAAEMKKHVEKMKIILSLLTEENASKVNSSSSN